MWVLLILLFLFAGAQAGPVEVRTPAELRDALEDAAVEQIIVAAKVLNIKDWPAVRIFRAVSIQGIPGTVLDFQAVDQAVFDVDAAGALRLSSLILAKSGPGVSGSPGPSQHVISNAGSVHLVDVVFYNNLHGAHALHAGDHKSSVANDRLQQSGNRQPSAGVRTWRLQDASIGGLEMTGCSVVLDAQSCYTAGSVVAFDSASLHAALSNHDVRSITVLQDITLQPEHCRVEQPVFIDRSVSLSSCPGTVLNLSSLDTCWVITSGGLLQLGQGLQLSHTASSTNSSIASRDTATDSIAARYFSTAVVSPYIEVLLSAVSVRDGGAVVMKDVVVWLSREAAAHLKTLHAHATEETASPAYRVIGSDSIEVLEWYIAAPHAQQQQQQMGAQLASAGVAAPQQQRLVAASRRLLQRQASRLHGLQQQQQVAGVGAGGSSMAVRQLLAPSPSGQNSSAVADTLHEPTTAANSHWKQPDPWSVLYPKENCFSDFRFLAQDITDFVRLIKDPASGHIELVGNLVFTEQLFPPANANNQSLGINVTHTVTIRACTGDPNNPFIVDINNLQQQIYVYGEMRWEGNIRFINSFPSPRRAGLFPLISVLSVEGDGVIYFEDVHIHGNEPCPLFDLNNPFWDKYGTSPLSSEFVPQRDDFELISGREILLFNWTFNKTAWVLNSQGTHGVVKAVGDGYWRWVDVLVTWAPDNQGPQGASMIAAIVVPIVVVCTVATVLGLLFWRRRRLKQTTVPKEGSGYFPSQDSQQVQQPGELGGFSTTTGTGVGLLQASGMNSVESKTENSKSNYNTHELIEEARRQMQDISRREANIVLEGLLGEGTFGKVYRGVWQGTTVAVKTMLFPAAMSGKEKREKMAIMETAISSSLSHPNIVQTFTYVVKPLTGELAMQAIERITERSKGAGSLPASNVDSDPSWMTGQELGENHGWEVRLVLELCDRGSLKELLNNGGLHRSDGKPNMAAIVATALDVARAMLHLHSENIIHSDLKARNVLLKAAGGDARGFVAKVSDFGLSVRMDPTETHVSNVYQGTLTHMAPEVLMHGKISRASDVYAYGILMWELYTAEQAFKGSPRLLLGHEVAKMGHRPEFPPDCPFDYQLLSCRCWESDPAIRPSFQQILADLERMARKISMADSASSLPMPAQQQRVTDIASQMHGSAATGTKPIAPAGPPQTAAAGGIDPAKLHNWEPQTSLLDLRSVGSTQGSSPQTESAVTTSLKGSSHAHQHISDFSWGTQSAGGLWLGGEFAPSDMPSGVHLPVHSGLDHVGQAAAGAHREELAAAVTAAAAAGQRRTVQQAAAAEVTQGLCVSGPAVARATDLQQQLHAHHPFVTNIPRPQDLQDEKQLQQQQQQHLQEQVVCLPGLDASSCGGLNSASSSGVYMCDQSSTTCAGSDSGSAICTATAAAGSNACEEPPEAGLAFGHIPQQHSSMATIAEEAERQSAK